LAHDYVIKENPANNRSFVFKRDHGEPHLTQSSANPNVIYLNRETYARDFLEAQQRYFEKVEGDQNSWDQAMKRLKHQKGFLTVRPEEQLIVRPTTSPTLSAPGASVIGLSTGTSSKPSGIP
jgi:hypothetical protein